MKKMISVIVSILALTVMAPGHAEVNPSSMEPVRTGNVGVSSKDHECLAKNIFYESANEPTEGKIAVGIVTINRAQDDRFPNSICDVVKQRTILERVSTVTTHVKSWFTVKEVKTQVRKQVAVCQFSWNCEGKKAKPHALDERWEESKQIAYELLSGGFVDLRFKYQDAIYFHAVHVRPSWASSKSRIERVGGHIFYGERQ